MLFTEPACASHRVENREKGFDIRRDNAVLVKMVRLGRQNDLRSRDSLSLVMISPKAIVESD